MDKHEVLKKYFGYSGFRSGQEAIIDQILQKRDVLAVMPTGAGKSLCYQIPALMLDGITVVISPLIALMKDQVTALVQAGVKAAYINSSLTERQRALALKRAGGGAYKIIYVSPERLILNEFKHAPFIRKISMLVVDESHCIVSWGFNFRRDYLKITEFVGSLSVRPIICAFTATATLEVRDEIQRLLNLSDPFVIVTGFNRENLYFEVRKPQDKSAELLSIVDRLAEKSGIIYCSTRKAVEQVCKELVDHGFSATRYHAGLTDEERAQNQDDFIFDRKLMMVATNAFGMGINKPSVSFVIHYNMPKDLDSYYQEAGRAGRDGSPAECILLYSGQDVATNQFLLEHGEDRAEMTEEERKSIRQIEQERLKRMTIYCKTNSCLREYILEYFGEQHEGYCGNCSNCNTYFVLRDITPEAQKIVSCVGRLQQQRRQFGKTMIVDILSGSKNARIKQMNLDQLSTYGTMAGQSKQHIFRIMDYLIENDYLALSGTDYPIVTYGPKYREVTAPNAAIEMMIPQEYQTGTAKLDRAGKRDRTLVRVDDPLMVALRELRKRIASENRIPAYMVFSDTTLSDMCRKLPRTLEEFGRVWGVGAQKQERYGELFLDVIKEHADEQQAFTNAISDEINQFTVGADVFHRSFGKGTITHMDGIYASIRFRNSPEIRKFNLEMCIQKNLLHLVIDTHDMAGAGWMPRG